MNNRIKKIVLLCNIALLINIIMLFSHVTLNASANEDVVIESADNEKEIKQDDVSVDVGDELLGLGNNMSNPYSNNFIEKSLMFNQKSLDMLSQKIEAYKHFREYGSRDNLPTEEAFHLSMIAYHGPQRWTLKINDQIVDANKPYEQIKVKSVSSSEVKFEWITDNINFVEKIEMVPKNNSDIKYKIENNLLQKLATVTFTLRVNQSFVINDLGVDIKEGKILVNKLPPSTSTNSPVNNLEMLR